MNEDPNTGSRQAGESPLAVQSRDGRLKAEFFWEGDRYAHRLSLDDRPLATSVEGDANAPWPPSPPLQQLSLELIRSGNETTAQPIVLGVGAAGRGHWSVSAGSDPDHPDALLFDLACRRRETAAFLGSTYELVAAASHPTLSIESLEDCDLQPDIESSGRVILTADTTDQPTVRWRYRVIISSS